MTVTARTCDVPDCDRPAPYWTLTSARCLAHRHPRRPTFTGRSDAGYPCPVGAEHLYPYDLSDEELRRPNEEGRWVAPSPRS